MREAAKVNIDNTTAEEQDKEWANKFLYPDGRKPYTLFHNDQGYKHALDLVAKARAAFRKEQQQTSSNYTRTTVNNKPATKEQEKEVDEVFKEVDSVFSNISRTMKKISNKLGKIGK